MGCVMEDYVAVVAGIVYKDDKVPIAQRKSNSSVDPDKWEFPQGKLKPGETNMYGVWREVMEETGVHAKVLEPYASVRHKYAEKPRTMILEAYLALWLDGDARPVDCQDARWELPQNFVQYDFTAASLPIMRKVMDDHALLTARY